MMVGSECSRNHLSCWTEGECGSSNSSVMVYSKAFSFRLRVKKTVQHDISDLSIGLNKSAGDLPNVSAVQRGGGGGGEVHVFRSFLLQKLQMLWLTPGPGARATAEVFGTEPCCLNIYSPLPLRFHCVLQAVCSSCCVLVHRISIYNCFKTGIYFVIQKKMISW